MTIWLLATAAAVTVAVPADPPLDSLAARMRWDVVWEGAAATVERADGDGWRTVAGPGPSPLRTPPIRAGTALRLRYADGHTEPVPTDPWWEPASFAAASGAGLRGAHITAVLPDDDGPWVTTWGGGVARWNGEAWRHLDTRQLTLPAFVHDALRIGEELWIAAPDEVLRVLPDGEVARWALPGAFDLAPGPLGVVAATPDGVWSLPLTAPAVPLRLGPTHRLLGEGGDLAVVTPSGAVRLRDGQPPDGLDPHDVPLAVWPRDDSGAWWLLSDQLRHTHATGGVSATPLPALPLALASVYGHLLVVGQPASLLLRADRTEPLWIGARQGLPGAATGPAAPARSDKVWLGTDHGLALLDAGGAATALPLAPLPAGVGVRVILPTDDGLACATDRGLRWIGEAPDGWDALAAAVGEHPAPLRLAYDGAWWSAVGEDALRLHEGRLTRWPTAAEIRHLAPAGRGVAIVGPEGARWWAPGATQLSPVTPSLTALAAGSHDGTLWVAGGREVEAWLGGRVRRWTLPSPVVNLPAPGAAALVVTRDTIVELLPDGKFAERPLPVQRPEHLTPWNDDLVVIDEARRLHAPGRDGALHLAAPPTARQVYDLTAVGPLVLLATDVGIWAVRPDAVVPAAP